MKVLVACEFSGVVRRAFRERGHDAWSCDLLSSEDDSPYHFQEDVFNVISHPHINEPIWNLMIAQPNRWKERSRTYEGIAKAMAEQWG